MVSYKLWEVTTETTDQAAATVEVSPVVAQEVDLVEAEALLSAVIEVETEAIDLCLRLSAAIVERLAKFLLDPQTVNRSTVVTVLRKWAIEAIVEVTAEEAPIDLGLRKEDQVLIPIRLNLTQ